MLSKEVSLMSKETEVYERYVKGDKPKNLKPYPGFP